MKRILIIILSAILFVVVAAVGMVVYSLNKGVRDYEVMNYASLPVNVSARFKQMSDSLVSENEFRCVHTNPACDCNMQTHNRFPFPSAYITLETCDEKKDIDFNVSTLRFFIVDETDVYFIVLDSFSYNELTTLSSIVDLEAARFGKVNM